MRIQATAGRHRKLDLRHRCYKLVLTASDDTEQELLARLYRCIRDGDGERLLTWLKEQGGEVAPEGT